MRYVKSSENRAAGASKDGQLRGHCNGQAFRVKLGQTPNPRRAQAGCERDPRRSRHGVDQPSGDESVSYANCDAARAAGAAPLTTDDPGYACHLDRDGDGIACEN